MSTFANTLGTIANWVSMFPTEKSMAGQGNVDFDIAKEIATTEREISSGSLNAGDTATAKEYLQWLRTKYSAKDDGYVGTPGFNPQAAAPNSSAWDALIIDYSKGLGGVALDDKSPVAVPESATDTLFGGGGDSVLGFIKSSGKNIAISIFGVLLVGGALFLMVKGNGVQIIKETIKDAV